MTFSLEGIFECIEAARNCAALEEGHTIWLFFGSDRGGQILATLASFTATCQLCKLNPWTWLRDTLTRLPVTPADQLADLLPKAAE